MALDAASDALSSLTPVPLSTKIGAVVEEVKGSKSTGWCSGGGGSEGGGGGMKAHGLLACVELSI